MRKKWKTRFLRVSNLLACIGSDIFGFYKCYSTQQYLSNKKNRMKKFLRVQEISWKNRTRKKPPAWSSIYPAAGRLSNQRKRSAPAGENCVKTHSCNTRFLLAFLNGWADFIQTCRKCWSNARAHSLFCVLPYALRFVRYGWFSIFADVLHFTKFYEM